MECSETVPIQYQEGKVSFMGMDVAVDERVLIPRPETELLCEVTRDLLREGKVEKPFILDVGTGSGVIPITLAKEFKGSSVIGADICTEALAVALDNVRKYGFDEVVLLTVSDMFSSFKGKYEERFDCIVSNPPYVSEEDYKKLDPWVKAEPKKALYAGPEGMDYLTVLAEEGKEFLKEGGFLAVEVGYDQADKMKDKLRECGFSNITSYRDFNDYERVIVGWKHG